MKLSGACAPAPHNIGQPLASPLTSPDRRNESAKEALIVGPALY
jgi:hypothetical protein